MIEIPLATPPSLKYKAILWQGNGESKLNTATFQEDGLARNVPVNTYVEAECGVEILVWANGLLPSEATFILFAKAPPAEFAYVIYML